MADQVILPDDQDQFKLNEVCTLQLRLTLIPDTEDENGGSGNPS